MDDSFPDLIPLIRRMIGPATALEAETPEGREYLQEALAGGMDELDAGLALAKERAASVRACGEEFFDYFYRNFGRRGADQVPRPVTEVRDSEDLLQSTFTGIWKDLARLRFLGRGPLFRYLHLRMKGKRNQYYRAALRDLELRERLGREDRGVDPLDESAADVVAVLAMFLTKDYREVFLLRARGLGHREIAEQQGITEESSRKCFQRAMNELRRRFGEDDPDDLLGEGG